MRDTLPNRLQAYCTHAFPAKPQLQVRNLVSITTGWESEMYAFEVEYGPATQRRRSALVLRLYAGEQAQEKAAHEFSSLRQLYETGYPVPYVHLLERTEAPFGRPCIIMERIAGQVMGLQLFSVHEEQQLRLMRYFCTLIVQLHQLDWRPFVSAATHHDLLTPYGFVERSLRSLHDTLARFSLWGFRPIVDWLAAQRQAVPCLSPALVHGDFHPYNILLRPDGSAVVIDWTGFRVADARFDLAWTLYWCVHTAAKSGRSASCRSTNA